MALRTPEQYLKGLRDGREVYYRGERVEDVIAAAFDGGVARAAQPDAAGRCPARNGDAGSEEHWPVLLP